MNNINLSFDSIKMDCSLADNFFKKNKCTFYGILNGSPLNSCKSSAKDSFGNTVHLPSIDSLTIASINNWHVNRNEEVLKKITNAIKNNVNLISQIEYSVRKILPMHTEKYLKNALKYFEYCADCIPFLKSESLTPEKANTPSVLYYDDYKPLWEILYEIAISFSLGHNVEVRTSSNTTAISVLLHELFSSSGLPKNTFNIVPTEDAKNQNYSIENEQGILFAVFEKCDLDSAVDCLVRTLYPFDYCSHLYLKQIFVQESVYKIFIEKLKSKIIKIDTLYPENFKIINPMQNILNNLEKIVKYSVQNNVNHIPMNEKFYGNDPRYAFKPFILIDNSMTDNFWEDKVNKSFHLPVGMQAFRTTKEVLNLIQKNPAYAVSLWCDNGAVADEMALLADVNCVWINSCGKMSGPVGWMVNDDYPSFYNEINILSRTYSSESINQVSPIPGYQAVVDESLKLQEKWKNYSSFKKSILFAKAVADLESQKKSLISQTFEENGKKRNVFRTSFDDAVKYIITAANICKNIKNNLSLTMKNTMCIQMVKPFGVVGVTESSKYAEELIQMVIAPVIVGNSVILSTNSSFGIELCKILKNAGLPISLFLTDSSDLQPIAHDALSCIFICSADNEITSTVKYTNSDFPSLKSYFSSLKEMSDSKNLICGMFSRQKLIWKTYGETFAL